MPPLYPDATIANKTYVFPDPSPAIPSWLNPKISWVPSGSFQVGTNSVITVEVTRLTDVPITGTPNSLTVQLWICNPSTALDTTDAAQAARITPDGNLGLFTGATATVTFNWTPTSTDTTKAAGPGHRCLITRCFFDTDDTPALSKNLYAGSSDWRYAQHNLDIVQAFRGGEGPPQRLIQVTNLAEHPADIAIRVQPDLNPTARLREYLLPQLRRVSGFRQIALTNPPPLALSFPEFPAVHFESTALTGCIGKLLAAIGIGKAAATHTATVALPAGRRTPLVFRPDMSGTPQGDAHIFHVTQSGRGGALQGGITVVTVAV